MNHPVRKLNIEEEIDECIALEIMRSLPSDNLSALIFDSIWNHSSLHFLNVVNIKKGRVNLLVTPSTEDKIILINAIVMCLSKLGLNNMEIKYIVQAILNVYNTSALKYIESNDINFYDVYKSSGDILNLKDLTFLTTNCVATIDNWLECASQIPEEDLRLFKVQMFIYASVWFDMDEYLKYLYYLYK